MQKVDARGQQCPIPVIMTKEAIGRLQDAGKVEVLVDNEIAVQNLTKMAKQKGYGVHSKQAGEDFCVVFEVGEAAAAGIDEEVVCYPDAVKGDAIVVISSDSMGDGDRELGTTLLKGFIFALAKADVLPKTIIFYNRGAFVAVEGSPSIEDLKSLEAQGTEIMTCGTCLNHYGLTEKLAVGSVTNMYSIVEIMTRAAKIIKP
jgi:selenium metabolism protein YedF